MTRRKSKTPKKDSRAPRIKDKYHIRNWKQYNQALVNRGSITFWFSDDVIKKWLSTEKPHGPGRPQIYSDDAIRCGLMIKALFCIPFRMLQGLVLSLMQILGLSLACPNYTVFCRRAKGLRMPMRRLLKRGEKLHVIFDSTGLKVYGEGEWKVRKHGYSKRRTWRKIHVGMCAETGQVVVHAISSNDVSDDTAMIQMMGALEGENLGDILGDGAYDTIDCREVIHDMGGRQIIPPDKNARLQKREKIKALEERDQAIKRIEELGAEGRALWKQEVDYHRRSRVETLMFRYKTILGDRLSSRRDWSQETEVTIRLEVLNRMTELGMPKSYKVAA